MIGKLKQSSLGRVLNKSKKKREERPCQQSLKNTISNSNVRNCNKNLWMRNETKGTKRSWELGKIMGVTYGGNEDDMVREMEDLEGRDQQEI